MIVIGRAPLFVSDLMSAGCAPARGSDQTTQLRDQDAALILRSDRDAQEIFDPGLVEMPYENAVLPQPGREPGAAAAVMAGENKIRQGWQHLEAQLGQGVGQRFATRHD